MHFLKKKIQILIFFFRLMTVNDMMQESFTNDQGLVWGFGNFQHSSLVISEDVNLKTTVVWELRSKVPICICSRLQTFPSFVSLLSYFDIDVIPQQSSSRR